jgi:alanine racemase
MIYLDDILATGGRLHGPVHARRFTDLAFDSRRLKPGQLFLAVKSDTGDGHDYIAEAIRKGASGVLCQRVPADVPRDVTCVLVEDTRQALWDWARFILQKYNTRVIAVTGSSGKTIAKEAIAAVLSTRFSVFKSHASYSGRYGLPIALGRLEPFHRIAVLELAADSLGEVRDLAALTQPQVGVVTAINRAHVETLGSIEAIEREKGQLIKALPAVGLAVLNRDDGRVWGMRARTQARVVSFGFDERAEYVAGNVRCARNGLTFALSSRRMAESAQVSLQLLGRHHVYAALAAIAVGQAYDVPLPGILAALESLDPLPGRLRPVAGRNGATLLDDSYDAGPDCTLAALDALAEHFSRHRRIVVLGGMRQLGTYREEAYRRVGERAAQVADRLVLKGERAQTVRQAALSAGLDESRMFMTYTNEEAARYLGQTIGADDVVLVKGTRGERMEEIVRGLMRYPEQAGELLVRQEAAFRHAHLDLPERPTWLEVDLEAIAHNLRLVRHAVGDGVGVMVVLKADGYGHGAVRVARTAVNNGARMLGVACLSEGVVLRRAGIGAPILVLGYTPAWQAREVVLNDITATAFDLDMARAFSRAAGEVGRTAHIHVKVDTGMGRLGLLPDEVLPFLRQAATLPSLAIGGIFTHFAVADETDKTYTYWQLDRFRSVLQEAREAGFAFPLVHAANSAAILSIPEARFNMVRLGIALYGLAPSADTPLPPGFRPALSFKTRVAQVKALAPGSFVSYGNTYQTRGQEQIVVIPVGYADGFRRAPAHWGYVLVKGRRAPIVGRVCMDQTMIDVTHIPNVRQGDEVVLIGHQGGETITVEEVAARLGTINYEVISEILARVPRVS